jgi:hypothetical protein
MAFGLFRGGLTAGPEIAAHSRWRQRGPAGHSRFHHATTFGERRNESTGKRPGNSAPLEANTSARRRNQTTTTGVPSTDSADFNLDHVLCLQRETSGGTIPVPVNRPRRGQNLAAKKKSSQFLKLRLI